MIHSSRASEPRGGRSRLARAGLLALSLAIAAALGLLTSSCGGSSSPGVAQVETTTTTTTGSGSPDGSSSADPAAFSACMRSHGLPNFPDPDRNGRIRIQGVEEDSAQSRAAWRACRKLAPDETAPSPAEQARERAQLLKFSACMRANGLPEFPDPQPSGGLSIGNSGIDDSSPQFKAAWKACKQLLPGAGESSSAPAGTP